MVFRNLIFCACLVGLVSGLVLTAVQALGVTPIIVAAEAFEVAEEPASGGQGHHRDEAGAGDHPHEADAHRHGAGWVPRDGGERTFYSALSNVLAGVGFAAVLLALISQFQGLGWVRRVSAARGVAWGLAGFAVVFLVPAVGLPPEIPGVTAAPLEQRQLWWLLTVVASGTGLGVIALAPNRFKILGVLPLAVPFLIGAPHPAGPEFSHPDAQAVAALTELHHRFILASGASNLVFWLVTGVLCAVLFQRYIQDRVEDDAPVAA